MPKRQMRSGFVYFIYSEATGLVKVGFSNNPTKRFETLSTASPTPLQLLGFIGGGLALEKGLHHEFGKFRVTGEWFRMSPSIIAYMRQKGIPVPPLPNKIRRALAGL